MESTSDTVRDAFTEARGIIDTALDDYGTEHHHLREAVRTCLRHGRQERNELALPLLVHAAETGDPRPAAPIAAVHALWWRAANAFDDIADGDARDTLYGLPTGAALMAALDCGHALPLRLLRDLPVAEALRHHLVDDFLTGCSATNDGQIADLLNQPDAVGLDEVLRTYRHKSASSYVMATSMAARLAGADANRIEHWRRFAESLGVLGQFHNDQEDLTDGPGEDLTNGTATHLLVQLFDSADEPERHRLRSLLRRARDEDEARSTLHELLLEPHNVARNQQQITRWSRSAHDALDALGQASPHLDALRARVDAAATPCSALASALDAANRSAS